MLASSLLRFNKPRYPDHLPKKSWCQASSHSALHPLPDMESDTEVLVHDITSTSTRLEWYSRSLISPYSIFHLPSIRPNHPTSLIGPTQAARSRDAGDCMHDGAPKLHIGMAAVHWRCPVAHVEQMPTLGVLTWLAVSLIPITCRCSAFQKDQTHGPHGLPSLIIIDGHPSPRGAMDARGVEETSGSNQGSHAIPAARLSACLRSWKELFDKYRFWNLGKFNNSNKEAD